MSLKRISGRPTQISLVKSPKPQEPILDTYRSAPNSEIQLAKPVNRLTPFEIYTSIIESNLSPLEQQKLTDHFIERADQYIEKPGVFTTIFGLATLLGVVISTYNLWKNGLMGAIGSGGLTAMVGTVYSHFEQQGKIERRHKMISFAESLSYRDSLDPEAKTALQKFIRNSRSANCANY